MIVVTGAAGFIGSCLIGRLNQINTFKIVAVDKFSHSIKNQNLANKKIYRKVDRDDFHLWLMDNYSNIDFIIHLGARTDTSEVDEAILTNLNTAYSKIIWQNCVRYQIPLIYASSAATYGSGEFGYNDNEDNISRLNPINAYAKSKNDFDKWVLNQVEKPKFWAGLKFFNVYGPNEYHKGRMASVIFHGYNQMMKTGKIKLFKSLDPNIQNGAQRRDFVYVKDVINVIAWLMRAKPQCGIFNIGTGKSRTFLELSNIIFEVSQIHSNIEFIETPELYRKNYQNYTQAVMRKFSKLGYHPEFLSLEDGIKDYVKNYLANNSYY